jgi:ABC-type polysaccharide/polyol phosphate export permease
MNKGNSFAPGWFGLKRNHLQLLRLLVGQELTLRYKRSILGIGWTMLNPMLTSLVLWLVFSFLFAGKLESGQLFAPYLMAGVLMNTFFHQGLIQAAGSISNNAAILTKVAVPPRIFAFAAALAALSNFLIGLLPLAFVVYASGQQLSIYLPIVLVTGLFLTLLITGLGLMLSILYIRFDDTKNIVNVLLLILVYLTPVFYPIAILSDGMQRIVSLNPLTSYLDVFRWSFSGNAVSTWGDFIFLSLTGVIVFVLGNRIFRRLWPKTVAML